MKTLYDDDYRCTADGTALDERLFAAITPIFEEWVKKGYSPREIAGLLHAAASELEIKFVLNHRYPF